VVAAQTVGEVVKESTAALGEKINVRRFERCAGQPLHNHMPCLVAHLRTPMLLLSA
jgi:translation elongation factor EF-Ts